MSKFYKALLLAISVYGISFTANAQFDYWNPQLNKAGIQTDKAVARLSFPKEFKLYNLDIEPLRQELFKVVDNRIKHTTIISLPNADGNIEQFEVNEASNFDPALQARFPEIRAFSGKGITDKGSMLKLSISPQGIQTMVFRTNGPNEYSEPYSQDHTVYAVFKSQRNKGDVPWVCSTPDEQLAAGLNSKVQETQIIESNVGELKTMRLAQSCNGEYANWFGATTPAQVGLVLAAFNATLTRCNGCYEKDLAIHLNLVPETVNVIFYDPATDPYTTIGNWNTQLQITLNTSLTGPATPLNVNNAAYDIGHMFGASGGGGNAGCIGCVCVDGTASGTGSTKGRGITSPADGIPQGDNFDIDYVAHEVGHQMGGNHTFSHSLEGTGVNKEVGAGITIMGYAGITNYDPAPHSIDIFHQASIQQIQVNMSTKTCPITTNITANNATPVVNPQGPYTIPISTPFALTGSATDANPGDVLTYCWEQNDNSTTSGVNSVASPTKLTGPNWLTFPATTSPTKLFPILSTILAGAFTTGPLPGGDPICTIEALSSVTRALNFRLTVRDNVPYSSTAPITVGQTNFTNVVVNVTNAAGPFAVTLPNGGENFAASSTQTVTWNVNGTNGAPINVANVKILLSTDGGITFPTVLLASTPNDGSEAVTFPGTVTTTARIKIEAIGNIFFDISNGNFTLSVPPAGFTFNNPSAVVANCPVPVTMTSTNLTANYFGGFTNNITLTASGNPPGTTVSFSTNPLTTAATSTTVNLNNANILPPGTYTVTATGTSPGAQTQTRNIVFTINPVLTITVNRHPADQTVCNANSTSFSVAATGANGYQWQISTNFGASYSDIPGATSANYNIAAVTMGMNGYRYRCVVTGFCTLPVTSNAGILTVIAPVAVTGQPVANSEICSGTDLDLTVSGNSTQPIVYQWQVSTNGGASWYNLSDGGLYSGTATATLTITRATTAISSYKYRCLLSNATCTVPSVSGSGTLLVRQLPSVGLSAAPLTSLLPGQVTLLTATPTSSTGGALSYSWYFNGASLANAGNTRPVNVQQVGDYQVKIRESWPTGLVCSNQSSVVSIKAAESPNLFIFPTPNDGHFTISYFNIEGVDTKRTITIYDLKGTQVFNRQFDISGAYTLIPVDLTTVNTGIYIVLVGDAKGKVIAFGKVHIK
jgi:hypothetical protein